MPKYRKHEEYYQLVLDDVGTKIIDLHTASPISAIRLNFFGTNGITSNKDNNLNDVITKLEIVDGSDQLLSLSLKEAQALEFRRTGKMPHIRIGESASGENEESVLLLFGRAMWDNDLYFDLSKFKNPQLKITTNIAAIRAAGDTGFLSNSLKVTMDMYLIEEGAGAAVGFMMAKNVYGFTSGASGDEHIDMPTDYPYVGLLMRAYLAGYDVDLCISKLKINCDSGKFIPIEKKVKDLYRIEEEDFGPGELRHYIFRKDAEWVYHILNHDPMVVFNPGIPGRIAGAYTAFNGRFKFNLRDNLNAPITTEELTGVIIRGSCLHSSIHIPFGLRADPTTYFDPTLFGDIDLVLTQAAASAVSIVLEQLRDYAAK